MVVGCKERHGTELQEKLHYGVCDGHAVLRAGSPTRFVHDDKAVFSCISYDVGTLPHFNHEGGLSLCQVVIGTDTGEDTVRNRDFSPVGRDEESCMGHEHDKCRLTEEGGFTGHVGARYQCKAAFFGGKGVPHESSARKLRLHDGVTTALNDESAAFLRYHGTDMSRLTCALSRALIEIEL